MSFDSIDDYITISSQPTFSDMDDFTISFMIQVENGEDRQEIISKDHDGQPTGDWSCFIENNQITFELRIGSKIRGENDHGAYL